ncbi:major facilitator superfamily MFS_1 [Catenulispora acidiphila DSM 44928]|uniref:Major facilitator superfamily MFS_1 n=1 Tax=Catenulispora acidiphila (strain DSM 44928 / JCM 14897 / NBRC 102108 / NRRL B-24433 / ID139908) TaxID=479433 RepID=C7QB58_CATAD|nr:MFS transporter [Catenulispora acidiphila]ACU76349.1 major facilitator superfamily MFS_1 [Catenulispora acidiphila DSM 44928]
MTDVLDRSTPAAPEGPGGTATTANITDFSTTSGLSARAKLVLFLLCAANFMVAVDFSILNIAVPSIGKDLHIADANLQWIATAFALPSGGLLLLSGRVGDLVGRKKVFITGTILFTSASVIAAIAWVPAVLLAGRALQGIGAAMIVPTGMALLTTSFPEGPQRERALGINGTLMTVGFTAGMVLGGVLTQALSWRSTMVLNTVMGAVVLLGAPRLLTESRNPHASRLDVPGAATVTTALLALIYALSTAAQAGFGRPDVVIGLVAGVALLAAFVFIESRAAEPLVSLRILRRRNVAIGNIGGLITFACMSAVVFLGTLFLQQVEGMSPTLTGLVFAVMGVAAALGGMIAPRLIGRYGARTTLVGGLIFQGALILPLALIAPGNGTVLLLTIGAVAAFGHLAAVVSYGVTATSGLGDTEQGLATGLVTTSQQVGLTLGIPLLSAVASARSDSLRTAGHSAKDALTSGIQLSMGADGVVVLVAAALVWFGLRAKTVRAETVRSQG